MQAIHLMFEFFWLVCGVFAAGGNAAYFRASLSAPIARGEISNTEANRFTLGVLGWLGAPCVALWIIQRFLADSSDVDFRLWRSPFNWLAIAIVVTVWVVGFVSICFLGGDRKLSRIYTLAGHQVFLWKHPIAFRIMIAFLIAVGVIALTVGEPLAFPNG
jgi:hypothetical protein